MTEHSGEQARIDDDQLPDDLVPGDENPLAEELPQDADPGPGDLLEEGKRATESADDETDAEHPAQD